MRVKAIARAAVLLLVLALTACAAPSPVTYQAKAQPPTSPVPLTFVASGELIEGSAEAQRYLASTQEVEPYIYECLMAEQTDIDLSAYKIPTDRIVAVFTDVMNTYPELFFVEAGISYTYTSAGHVVTLKPSYRMTGKALADARADCHARLDDICAGVDGNWSDFEIALYLHDYLCLHFAYDTTYQIYDMYQFLMGGTGVCQAYTLTYAALLQRFGIKTDVAVSESMNHIWNIVILGGQPYHVDVTWDDPLPDVEGQVLHQNFLRSDAGIAQTAHYGWVADYTCSSNGYESTFLVNVNQPFCYTAGQWFYADGAQRTVYATDFTTMRTTSVVTLEDKWLAPGGGSYYVDAFCGTGTYRGNLIYNTPKSIWAKNLQSGVTVEVKIPALRGKQIFGLWVIGDTVFYRVSNAPDGQMQTLTVRITDLADYLQGDADQNGVVDGRDVTAVLRYLEGLPTVCHTGAADMDDSGTVDARDAQLLRQFIVENH